MGRALVRLLTDRGHEVAVLSRSPQGEADPGSGVRFIQGDPARTGPWTEIAAQADTVINLAGESIFKRWTGEVKQGILESRLLTTRNVVKAMSSGASEGKTLLNASAVGYYGFRGDEDLDESSRPGNDFLARVTRRWEAEAVRAGEAGVREVLVRFGVVLAKGGGALNRMLPLFRWGLGGKLGDGRQWFPWIHRLDLLRAAGFLLDRPEARGPFNFTAPVPVRNAELTKALGRAVKRPAIIPGPGFMINLVLGEFGSLLLEGQKALPRRLLDLGFEFQFKTVDQALADLAG